MTIINKILIFEGIDKAGKSFMKKELLKKYQKQMTIDRLFISNLVYDDFYNRNYIDHKFISTIIDKLRDVTIIIYVYCNYDTYVDRCVRTSHEILNEHDFIKQHQLFIDILKKTKVPYVAINSTKDDIKEQLNTLKIGLNKYE